MTPRQILSVLDDAARACTFPMLDNGYVYLAATRLSLHAVPPTWALVFEVFGFSPRAGLPDTAIVTFSNALQRRKPRESFVSEDAYRGYLRQHPYDEFRTVFPCDEGDWADAEDGETVSLAASEIVLRSRRLNLPTRADYDRAGVELEDESHPRVWELCRALAHAHRESVLATESERRENIPADLPALLVLDEWNHPDLAAGVLPSQSVTFTQIAKVLGTGDASHYASQLPPNTHWTHWPAGGTL